MNNSIYISLNKDVQYPDLNEAGSPSVSFPEYKFGSSISKKPNQIYAMVRECLYGLGLDKKNFGTPNWNPLGDVIKKNSCVVIKPNMVKHDNPSGELECLVTNISIVRAVTDYVLIALDGTGKIIIGDAPVQTCDFEQLKEKAGYNALLEFYKTKDIDIKVVDFRGTVSKRLKNGALKQFDRSEGKNNSVLVDLGKDSAFYGKENLNKLRITNYSANDLLKHHNNEQHEYLVCKDVLEADVIINLPKPKTHRKAGITGALKNMVGICVEKEYLPHHTQKSVTEGGDEYPNKSFLKGISAFLSDKYDVANKEQLYWRAAIINKISFLIAGLTRLFGNSKDSRIREGSWSGNDTIWRTVCDLNRIVMYCDCEGKLHDQPVRKIFSLADMIVFGEGEGPLSPSACKMGAIIAGFDARAIDYIIASMMGINPDRIPSILHANDGKRYVLPINSPSIISNDSTMVFSHYEQMDYASFSHVKMPSGWSKI